MPFYSDVIQRFRPWRLNAHEDVQVPEDFARFDADLVVDFEEHEGLAVVVGGVFVLLLETVCIGVEELFVDVLADLRREGEEVWVGS